MRVLMVAPPGAGKGTQGALIADHFAMPYVAIGDLLRDHVARGTRLGRTVQGYLDRGELVPDGIVLEMVRQALTAAKATGGEYVLDGVPRTMEQAWAGHKIALELGMTADVALHLRADDDELIRRLLARAVVQHRSDDTEVVIRQRLELYHRLTQPIVSWYAKRGILVSVDGMRPARDVGREILATLEVMRPLVEYVPEGLRRPVDLSGLGAVFGEVTTLTTTPGLRARRRLGPYRPGEPDRSSRRDGGWRAGTQGQQSPRLRPYGGSEAHHDERRLG